MENSEQFDVELEELKQMLDEDHQQEDFCEYTIEEIEQEQDEPVPEKKEEKASWQKTVLLYLHDLIYLMAIFVVISLLLLRVVVVSGTSMNATLLDGDYLLVLSNAFYQDHEYGDVVVISKDSFDNGKPIVKRVIATGGQTVDIDFNLGIVYVDGEALEEPYVHSATTEREGVSFPLTVPEGCVFVLGDNRAVSKDSRHPDIGIIDDREVLGKVVFLFFPGTNGEDAYGNPVVPRDFTRIGVVD